MPRDTGEFTKLHSLNTAKTSRRTICQKWNRYTTHRRMNKITLKSFSAIQFHLSLVISGKLNIPFIQKNFIVLLNSTLQEKDPWIIHLLGLWNGLLINLPNFKTELLLSLLITIWSHPILFCWALRTLQTVLTARQRQEGKTPLLEHPGSRNTGMFQKSFWIS